jgi:hypothetical protein
VVTDTLDPDMGGYTMDKLITKLEQMKLRDIKVISIDYLLHELRGIPPTRQQTVEKVPKIDYYSKLGYLPAESYLKR